MRTSRQAFARSYDSVDASLDFKCLVPQWPFGEGVVELTIVGSSGTEAVTSESVWGLTSVQPFKFVGYWSELAGPSSGLALGGDRLNISWLVSNNYTAWITGSAIQPLITYSCRFLSDLGHSETSDVVVESVRLPHP